MHATENKKKVMCWTKKNYLLMFEDGYCKLLQREWELDYLHHCKLWMLTKIGRVLQLDCCTRI